MLSFDHSLITRQASVGVIRQKGPARIQLESATYDWFGLVWSGWVETVSIPVGDTDSRSRSPLEMSIVPNQS